MRLIMNIQFNPAESSESSESEEDPLDVFKTSVESFGPVIGEISKRMEGLQNKLAGYENSWEDFTICPASDEFKNFVEDRGISPILKFKDLFKLFLASAESLDLETRSLSFSLEDSEKYFGGVQQFTVPEFIMAIMDNVEILD